MNLQRRNIQSITVNNKLNKNSSTNQKLIKKGYQVL